MLNVDKLHELYNALKDINTQEFFQIISNARCKEEREFFIKVFDVILEQRQREKINI